MVLDLYDARRCWSSPRIRSTESDDRDIRVLYGAPLIPLDRPLYDSSSDGTTDPRDARHQYRYLTRTRHLARRTSLGSHMGTDMVGYFQELEEVACRSTSILR
jgi:hypothetical protein